MQLTQEQCQIFRAPKVIALTNQNGMKIILSSLGASWVSCILPLVTGKRDVVLGSPNMAKQMEQGVYLGSTVGRVANRINNSQFTLNEQRYQLVGNQGAHCLHGGKRNFSQRIWGIFQPTPQKAIFSLVSPAGEQGFPGRLEVEVSYELTEDNQVVIHHAYQSTEACPVNLANHIYFNLAGEDSVRTALEHDLYIDADQFLPTDMDGIPTGEWHNVAETNFDFRQSKRIGRDFLQDDVQHRVGGYDHGFILNNALTDGEQTVATLGAPNVDVRLNIATTQAALHVYSGNNLHATSGKTRTYVPYSGVVLATQFPADAINHPEWGEQYSSIAFPQQVYRNQTRYQFVF
ncbi:galactose-1-epimerase [Providencia huaxiensis]|uniref:galactose-1-epimerase n=1 Tax=Providencia huaxiensis TaxID=2027290 RepID=UPI0034E4DB88